MNFVKRKPPQSENMNMTASALTFQEQSQDDYTGGCTWVSSAHEVSLITFDRGLACRAIWLGSLPRSGAPCVARPPPSHAPSPDTCHSLDRRIPGSGPEKKKEVCQNSLTNEKQKKKEVCQTRIYDRRIPGSGPDRRLVCKRASCRRAEGPGQSEGPGPHPRNGRRTTGKGVHRGGRRARARCRRVPARRTP